MERPELLHLSTRSGAACSGGPKRTAYVCIPSTGAAAFCHSDEVQRSGDADDENLETLPGCVLSK